MYKALILNDDLEKSFQNDLMGYETIEHEKFVFSGGESHIKLKNPNSLKDTTAFLIITKITTAQDIMDIAISVDALDEIGADAEIHLVVGYLPGARQDRVCEEGEAFSAKVYANMLNEIYDWGSIQYIDAHSDVMPALLGGRNIDNKRFVDNAIKELDLDDFTIISPDAGANKKVLSLAQHINNKLYMHVNSGNIDVDVVRADKVRDTTNGAILETIVFAESLVGKDCVIVDDICDGGRTFIELAKVLKEKGARNVILMVTHGIFSKGYDVVLEHVDQVVTTNSFANLSDDNGDSITVIGLDMSYYKTR